MSEAVLRHVEEGAGTRLLARVLIRWLELLGQNPRSSDVSEPALSSLAAADDPPQTPAQFIAAHPTLAAVVERAEQAIRDQFSDGIQVNCQVEDGQLVLTVLSPFDVPETYRRMSALYDWLTGQGYETSRLIAISPGFVGR